MGERMTIQLADGPAPAYFATPKTDGPHPAVLFYMDALGLRQTLTQMADRLAESGYVVLLPELYYRAGEYAPFEGKKVFAKVEGEFERVMGMVKALQMDGVMGDTERMLEDLALRPEVKPGPVGTVGYCMGGGFALAAGCHFPDRIGAVMSFHGGGFVTEAESPDVIGEKMHAAVYLGVAETDGRHDAAVSERLEAALTRADVPHQIEVYAGAAHGFAVPDLPVFDAKASEQHWQRMLAWFGEHL